MKIHSKIQIKNITGFSKDFFRFWDKIRFIEAFLLKARYFFFFQILFLEPEPEPVGDELLRVEQEPIFFTWSRSRGQMARLRNTAVPGIYCIYCTFNVAEQDPTMSRPEQRRIGGSGSNYRRNDQLQNYAF